MYATQSLYSGDTESPDYRFIKLANKYGKVRVVCYLSVTGHKT